MRYPPPPPPPATEATFAPRGAYSHDSSSWTCLASSRVGTITIASGRAPRSPGDASPTMAVRSAKPMATVLPEPVCELTRRSRPSRAGSSTACWTGVRDVKAFRSMALASSGPTKLARSASGSAGSKCALDAGASARLGLEALGREGRGREGRGPGTPSSGVRLSAARGFMGDLAGLCGSLGRPRQPRIRGRGAPRPAGARRARRRGGASGGRNGAVYWGVRVDPGPAKLGLLFRRGRLSLLPSHAHVFTPVDALSGSRGRSLACSSVCGRGAIRGPPPIPTAIGRGSSDRAVDRQNETRP